MSNTPNIEPEIPRFFAGVDEGVSVDVERGMAILGRRIDERAPVPHIESRRSRKWMMSTLGIAAAMVIGIYAYQYYQTTICILHAPETRTFATALGEHATYYLDDGSRIDLAPATKVKVTDRNIELLGEAVFTVNQHKGYPLTVKSGNTITRVLGTTFGIRAYDNHVRIAVSDGKISVDATHVLSAGDVVNVINRTIDVQHNADVNSMLSWTFGRLEYHGALLTDVIPDINRWYGVEIHLASTSLKTQHFTGTLKPGSVAELANILELTYKAKVTRVGNVLTLETSPGR